MEYTKLFIEKANNKHMKDYEKKEIIIISYHHVKYWDINNLHGWSKFQKILFCGLNELKKYLNLMKIVQKSYNEDSDIGCFLKVDVQYPLKLHKLHNDLPFLPEIMKIEMFEKCLA